MENNCLDTHLNSPLSLTVTKECLNHLLTDDSNYRNTQIKIKTVHLKYFLDYLQISPKEIKWDIDMQSDIGTLFKIANTSSLTPETASQFDKYWSGLLSYVPYNLQQLKTKMTPSDYRNIMEKVRTHAFYREILHLYSLRCFLEEGVVLSARPESTLNPEKKDSSLYWKSTKLNEISSWVHTGSMHSSSGLLKISVTRNHCLLDIQNRQYLLDRNYLLLMSDIVSQRFLCYLASVLAESLNRDNYPNCYDLKLLFSMGDSLTHKFGNKGYNSLALWEALVISEVLMREDDPAVDNTLFRQNIVKEFIKSQEEGDNYYLKSFLETITIPWLRSRPITSIFQLFGLYRIWGHPTIDEIESVKKLQSVACTPRPVNYGYIDLVTCKWREYFCLSYFRKNGKWPNMTISETAPDSVLINALKQNIYIHVKQTGYNLNDWSHITFTQTFNIPEKLELSEVIADKATSLTEEELAKWCIKHGTIGPSELRSVIIQWLDTNYNNPEQFLKYINENGFPPGETVVGLHPKERELKIFARLFGLLTIGKRLYVVLTEALIASHLFPYFPEITMTYDAITLQNKVHQNTKSTSPFNQGKNNRHTVITNIDFVKWNSNMREEETLPLFRDFDHLHGLSNCFQRTHSMFTDSVLYLADGTVTPINKQGYWINSPAVWRNHLGGIEGLRQKGWTIFTVVILKYVAELLDVECQLMGQGDNQVLILTYVTESTRELKQLHSNFLQKLSEFLSYIGPPLKVEETWSSSHFFIYGKYPVYQGVPMSLSLKKICRAMRLTNDKLQNLESTCSSITANASAATASDHDPIIPYILGSFETLGAIDLHMSRPFFLKNPIQVKIIDKFLIPSLGKPLPVLINLDSYSRQMINGQSVSFLVSIATLPCILGGLPSLQLTDLVNHGFPDPLSLGLWGLKFLYSQLPEKHFLKDAILRMSSPLISPERNNEMICEDPTSINILRCSSASEKVKRLVFEFISQDLPIKNEAFKEFMQYAKKGQSALSDLLVTMLPFNPRVANSVLSSTISGRALQIVSKVNKTGTLIGMMKKHRESWNRVWDNTHSDDYDFDIEGRPKFFNFQQQFGKFEDNYLKSVIYQAYQPRDPTYPNMDYCSTQYAQSLRTTSWRLPVTGVTVAVPQEMLSFHDYTGKGCESEDHPNPEMGYFRLMSTLPIDYYNKRDLSPSNIPLGPFTPFFGTSTQNKIKYEGGELKAVAPALLQGILDLLCLIGWGTEKHSNFSELIRAIFGSMTDLDSSLCIPATSTISGTVEHRWQDKRTSHSSTISVLYHLPSYLNIMPNHFKPQHGIENVDSDNFNISFQTIYTWVSCLFACQTLSDHVIRNKCSHLHISCRECVMPIYEGMLEISEPDEEIMQIYQPQPDNPYCWITKESLLVTMKTNPDSLLPVLSSLDEVSNKNDLFLRSLCDFYFSEFPIPPIGQSFLPQVHMSSTVIPVNLIAHIDTFQFLQYIIYYRITEYMFHQSHNIIKHIHLTSEQLFHDAKQVIKNTPSIWYRGMVSLLLNLASWNNVRSLLPTLQLPFGSPPSDFEVWTFFKRTIDMLLKSHVSMTGYLNWCNATVSSTLPLSKKFIFSPLIPAVAYKILASGKEIICKESLNILVLLRQLFCDSRGSYSLNANTDPLSLVMSTQPELVFQRTFMSLKSITRYVQTIFKPRFLQVIPDAIVKAISRRVVVGDLLSLKNQPDVYSNTRIKLSSLPNSSDYLISSKLGTVQLNTDKHTTVKLPPMSLVLTGKSFINHLYKGFSPTTSASYKITSIFQHIADWVSRETLICTTKVISIFGDGLGGYTLSCGRIFPKAKLFFNTFHASELMPSNGINHYVPVSVSLLPSVFDRLTNLDFTTEINSDLLDSNYATDFNKLDLDSIIIICDAETDHNYPSKQLLITQTLLKVTMKSPSNKLIIIKSFLSRLDIVYIQYLMILGVYKCVKIIRSHFSNTGNTEVFLVGYLKRSQAQTVKFKTSIVQYDTGFLEEVSYDCPFHTSDTFDSFQQRIQTHTSVLNKDASKVHIIYSEVISFPEMIEAKKEQFLLWIKSLIPDNQTKLNFPGNLIRSWKKEFQFVKFSTKIASRWRPSFLTESVMRSMTRQYILLHLIFHYKSEYHDSFMNMINTWYICYYETVENSWGYCLLSKESPAMGKNRKVLPILEVLKDEDIKSILRDISIHQSDIKPYINTVILTPFTPYTPFCSFQGRWWQEIEKISVSPLLTPKTFYEQFIRNTAIILPPLREIDSRNKILYGDILTLSQLVPGNRLLFPQGVEGAWKYVMEGKTFAECYHKITFSNIRKSKIAKSFNNNDRS